MDNMTIALLNFWYVLIIGTMLSKQKNDSLIHYNFVVMFL